MFERRVTLLVGHFGSGKTEIALHGALRLAASGLRVTLADLDIVKPYFRSRAARNLLTESGVKLIVPEGENLFADLPIIVPQIRGALRDPEHKVIIDVGGDATGARVLGSLADVIPHEETACMLVLNFNRPATPDVDGAEAMVRQIEAVSRLAVTGLVSNTHLMEETTEDVVLEGVRLARETGRRLGVPVVGAAVPEALAERLGAEELGCETLSLERIIKPPFGLTPPGRRTTGPLFVLN